MSFRTCVMTVSFAAALPLSAQQTFTPVEIGAYVH